MSTRTSAPSLFRLFAARGRHIAVAGGLAILGLSATGTATAAPATTSSQLAPRLVGPMHWTSISGNSSSDSMILEPRLMDGENVVQFGASSFEWTERSDSPCWARLSFRALNGSGLGWWRRAEVARCAEHHQSRKVVSRSQPNEMITGIQVCLTDKSSSSKNKLKGVRLWGRTVDPETAAFGPTNGPSYAKRNHCAKWSRRAFCPSGEVAAKFKIFGATNNSGKHIRGISLGCREVELRPVMNTVTIQPPS